jgi:hypothetical protein
LNALINLPEEDFDEEFENNKYGNKKMYTGNFSEENYSNSINNISEESINSSINSIENE